MEEHEATRRLPTPTAAFSALSGIYEVPTQENGEQPDPEIAASWATRAAPRCAPKAVVTVEVTRCPYHLRVMNPPAGQWFQH